MLAYLKHIKLFSEYTESSFIEFKQDIEKIENENVIELSLLEALDHQEYELKQANKYNDVLAKIYNSYFKLLNLQVSTFEINETVQKILGLKNKHTLDVFTKISGLKSEYGLINKINNCSNQKDIFDFLGRFNVVYEKYLQLGGDTQDGCQCNIL